MLRPQRLIAFACLLGAVALVLIAGSGRLADERSMLEEEQQQQSAVAEDENDTYYMHPGKPQPKNGLHLDRQHDPWARDGYMKRGSFTVERKIEHGLHDKFWLVVTGTPSHRIRCSIRGYERYEGGADSLGWKHAYIGETALVTDLLPCVHDQQFDALTCEDLITGERRYFSINPWKPEHEKKVAPWETDQAVRWMKQNGLSDFTAEDAPLHGTRYESKHTYDYEGEYSPGEEFLYKIGHPPIAAPEYEEYMGGNLTPEEARASIPVKGDYEQLKKEDLGALKRKRVWKTFWAAWQAGLNKDKADNVPQSEWSKHWN